jgi:glycosyltransferase involved in cell wall biosynthesis
METSEVQVAIPTWNSGATLSECLKSIMCVLSDVRIYDRYSTDDTLAVAKQYGCTIHSHDENLGLTRTRMIRECSKPYLLMFDSDNLLAPNPLKELLTGFDDLKVMDSKIAAVQYLNMPSWEPMRSYCMWAFGKRTFPTKNPTRLDTACVLIDVSKAKGYVCDSPVYEDMALGQLFYSRGYSVYVLGYPVTHLQTKKQAYARWRYAGQYSEESSMSLLGRVVRVCVTNNIPLRHKPIVIRQLWENLKGNVSN